MTQEPNTTITGAQVAATLNLLQYGFYQGWHELKLGEIDAAKKELHAATGARSPQALWNYRNGKTPLNYSKAIKVLQVFNAHGIDQPFGPRQKPKK